MNNNTPREILIIGGGFAGVSAALHLDRQKNSNVHVRLVSAKPYFEYHGAMYRTVTGKSPLETCVPLRDIFSGTSVDVVTDVVRSIDTEGRVAVGRSTSMYRYDVLILALGMEPFLPDVPGLKGRVFGFQTEQKALELKRRVHALYAQGEGVEARTFVVIGAGSSGVEIAGEIGIYAKKVAKCHGADPHLVCVNIVEARDRILPMFPGRVAERVEKRLDALGVRVHLGERLSSIESDRAILSSGAEIKAETVIWTATARANRLYGELRGVRCDKVGRVAVNEFLCVEGLENVYVVGDGAGMTDSGTAQAAVAHAQYVARRICTEQNIGPYRSIRSIYALPIGCGWASVTFGNFSVHGRLGWIIRRLADFKVFLMFLPLWRAWDLFRAGHVSSEECPRCCGDTK